MNDALPSIMQSTGITTFKVPGEEGVHYQGTAAYFNEQLWYVHQHDRSAFEVHMAYKTVLTGPLATNPNSSSLWSSDKKIDDGGLAKEIRTENRPTVVSSQVRLFLFWANSDENHKLYATRRDATQNSSWARERLLLDEAGASISTSARKDAPLHVIAVTPDTLLVTNVRDGNTLEYHYFYDEDFDAQSKTWKARASARHSAKTIQKLLGNQDSGFLLMGFTSLAWFSQGATPENEDATGEGRGYIVQCLCFKTDKLAWGCLALTAPLVAPPQLPNLDSRFTTATQFASNIQRVFMIADPGGRVAGYFRDRGKDNANCLNIMIRSTERPDGAGTWSKPELLGDAKIVTAMPPSAQYVYGPLQAETLERAGKSFQVLYRDVREYVFYASDDRGGHNYTERCSYRHYGRVERVIDEQIEDFTKASAAQRQNNGLFFVQGYIDGPPPMPQINLEANPDGAAEGVTHYGQVAGSSSETSTRTGFKWGVKTEGNYAGLGAGPAWDMSMSMTIGSRCGSTEATDLSTDCNAIASIVKHRIQPYGQVFGRAIVLSTDNFYFRNARGVVVTDAPEVSVVQAEPTGVVARPYVTGTCTPGELQSYTREAWNLRMRPVYEQLYGQTITDYIAQVVEPNALPMLVGPSEQKYLSASWTVGGGATQGLAQTLSEFREESYQFDLAVWQGVKVEFKGIGEATVMAGVEFSTETTEATVRSQGFSIDTRVTVPDPGDQPGVEVYDYRLYFLPPPDKSSPYNWTKELIATMPVDASLNQALLPSIDPGSNCWKIIYLVSFIQYSTTIQRLVDFGLPESIAGELKARGIHGTGRLLAELGIARDAELAKLGPASDPREEAIRAALRRWNRTCM